MHAVHPRPVVLVTGAARRIGAAIARRLHAAGLDLALHCHHSEAALAALASELEAARSGSTLCLQADLADIEQLPGLVTSTLARFGRLDGLVNNASAFFPTPLPEATPQHWDTLFATNARAPFFLAQAAAPHLRAQRGAIVNLADIYAERPLPGHSLYCMAKAALVAMTRALAHELGPDVRINAIAPGAILWPDAGAGSERQQEIVARTPLQRTGSSEEIAAAVLWLLRDAGFVTGQVLAVDGGRTLSV